MPRNHRVGPAHSVFGFVHSLLRKNSAKHQRFRRGAATTANSPAETLEDRLLLAGVNDDPSNAAWAVAVDANVEQDVRALIDALGQVANEADSSEATATLSTVGSTIKTRLDDGGASVIQSSLNLSQPVADLFASHANPTIHDLAIAIDNAVKPFGGQIDVDLTTIGTGTANDLDLQILVNHQVNTSQHLSFDQRQFSAAGDDLKLDGNATIDVATSLNADVSLVVDLDTATRNEGVLRLDRLEVSTDLGDAAVDSETTYHFAKLTATGTSERIGQR